MILKTQDKINRVYSQNLLVFDFASTDREKERKNLMIEKSNTAIPVAEKQTTSSQIRFITITAMFIALTYVFTAFVNIKLPIAANGGLIHLGNVPLFIGAILFGKKTGAIAGGVGMGLFDLLSGWTAWAPFTFVIVGIMGYVVGAMTEKHDQYGWKVAAIFAAFVIKIVGYYIAEIILYGNFVAPMTSVPGNVVQIAVAAVVVLIVIEPIEIAVKKIGITQFA